MPDAYLDADAIRAATFVRHVEIHETIGSTNDRAAELARDTDVQLPALVAARHQIAGRGRGTNTWHSADGALTFSLLLDPATFGISAANWPQLSLATAVAVCIAISDELNPGSANPSSQSRRVAIKWPNDIILDDAKVCGILIESPGGVFPSKERVIVGIGINVNNTFHAHPILYSLGHRDPSSLQAVSLFDATSHHHNVQRLLCTILRAFEERIGQLANCDHQLPTAWKRLCWLTEQDVEVHANGKCINGVCRGIDDDGALLVEDAFVTHRIRSGSVRPA